MRTLNRAPSGLIRSVTQFHALILRFSFSPPTIWQMNGYCPMNFLYSLRDNRKERFAFSRLLFGPARGAIHRLYICGFGRRTDAHYLILPEVSDTNSGKTFWTS